MASLLEALFPGLAPGNYSVTSARAKRYDCIAWAAGETERWWWPGPNVEEEYWPESVPRVETFEAFQALFEFLGYGICDTEEHEPGFEKVAVFANAENVPKHGARQLPNGRWTSKLGALEDIEHALHDLEGDEYGAVAIVLKRPIPDRKAFV